MNDCKCFLFTLILVSNISFATSRSINTLKDKISNQSGKISKLAAEIRDIDFKISSSNTDYLVRMKEIEGVEFKITEAKKDLLNSANLISKEYKVTKKLFDNYLLESSDLTSDESLFLKSTYIKLLKNKLTRLQESQKSSSQLLVMMNELDKTLAVKKRDEEVVYTLIMDLEKKKKEVGESYISLMEFKNRNQEKLDKIIAKKRAYKKVKRKKTNIKFQLELPLRSFTSIHPSREGVTFKYKETTPIRAPGSGKVVYSGELASYGKVLIIDHGKDIRSVLLGDIVSKVDKNQIVAKNQIIGYTIADIGMIKSLYYEIRKKNIAQNTKQWLVQNTKNNKIKI